MFRKAINYILVALIALQSVAAFADVHFYQQNDTGHNDMGHVSTVGHHEHDINNQLIDTIEADATHDDCKHCCHCHGSISPFLNKIQNVSNFSKGGSRCPDYLFSMISFQDSPDNPPPIL